MLCTLSYLILKIVVVQLLIHVRHFASPWTPAHQAFQSFTVSQSLRKLMSIESEMPSNHLILCLPLLLLPSIFPNNRVFSNESALCIRWPKYWSFSISPSSEYSGLISFRIDWSRQLIGSNTICLLEIRKQRLMEVRLLAQGHIISK